MVEIKFGNQSRLDLIHFFIANTACKSYLEIGCDKNQVWDKIKNIKTMLGVDPVRGGNMRMTSDQFFSQNKHTFDVIFIDGLHTYEQVKRDVNNSLKVLNQNGVILIHDMLPRTKQMADPNKICKGAWLGDVYRLAFDLANRDDILFKLVLIDQGCGVVTKQNNPNPANFEKADWNYYCNNYKKLPLIEFNDITK